MEVFFIRHGQTAGNLTRCYVGRTDEPLCPLGIAAAQACQGHFPPVSQVYISPMRRVLETAALLFPGAEQRIYPGLREMDFGSFDGKSADEMCGDPAYRAWVESGCTAPCPGGEGRMGFSKRVCTAFLEVLAHAVKKGERQIVVLAHGGTMMAVLDRFSQPHKDYFFWRAAPLHGWRCRWEADALQDCRPI